MKRLLLRLFLLLPMAANGLAAPPDNSKVETAVSVIMTLCVGAGSTATIRSNEQNQIRIESTSGNVTLERHEAQGLVEGLNSHITTVQADQANRVRECVKPYIGDIVHSLLYPLNPVSEVKVRPYTPPAAAPSLLDVSYKTNYQDEASDFGRIPTIGLNRNVNDYTPAYLNGGAIITTGELEHAMGSGIPFALVDVLMAPHTQLPRAFYLPGAGLVDDRNDLSKQNWFVGRLLAITGGSYDFPIVLYCEGVRCWESYNAATRAIIGGFRNVYWYRGGVEAWFSPRNPAWPSAPAPMPPAPVQIGPARVAFPAWCPNAKKTVERLICGDAALADLDAKLNSAFQTSLSRLSPPDQQQLRRDQSSWLRQRDNCENFANTAGCVENAYRGRLAQLLNG